MNNFFWHRALFAKKWFLLNVSLTSLILETYYGDFISRVRVRVRFKVISIILVSCYVKEEPKTCKHCFININGSFIFKKFSYPMESTLQRVKILLILINSLSTEIIKFFHRRNWNIKHISKTHTMIQSSKTRLFVTRLWVYSSESIFIFMFISICLFE